MHCGGCAEAIVAELKETPGVRGADDYGWEVELRFDAWIRGQWRFPGPEALVARLREDVAECESRARAAAVA
ncbi:MAG: riboflavin kinase, partial [Phycisphaerales bacterium]